MAKRFFPSRCALVWLAISSANLAAQTLGSLEGSVTDATAAPVSGAKVRLFESQTGAERQLTTGPEGRYQAPSLAPGVWRVEVSHPGFRKAVREGIGLDAGRALVVHIRLEVGEVKEEVRVVEQAAMVSTSVADWGSSVSRQSLESLPLNGRDLFDLAAQEPGATVSYSATRTFVTGEGLQISVNGARANQNSFRVDGIYVNNAVGSAPTSSAGRTLGIEAMRELRLITSPFSAEYGRAAGAVFTAVSKSGDNAFHGSLYEYFRNSTLDARNFFANPAGPKPPLRQNQFGGLLSGPILHNRMFFVANYEAFRAASSDASRAITLDADSRKGIIGSRRIPVSPAVVPYLALYPLPNGQNFGDGTGELLSTLGVKRTETFVSGKLDYLHTQRLRFSGRYTLDAGSNATPDPFQVWNFNGNSRYQFIHTETSFVQSPNTIHTARAGFSRVRNGESSVPRSGLDSLAFITGQGLGAIRVTGVDDMGPTRARVTPRYNISNDFQFNYDVTHQRGSHSLRFGAGYDRVQYNQRSDNTAGGFYRFDSIPDLLQLTPRSADLMAIGADSIRGWRQNQFFAYAQDDFRVHRRVNLAIGVRYETYSVPTEVNGKIATLRDPLHDTAVTIGGPLFRNPSKKNFAPRASLAWDVTGSGKTVVRAGSGIFFDLLGVREVVIAGIRVPPFFNRITVNNPGFPDLLKSALAINPPNSLDGLAYNQNQPYVGQFQFALQHQLGADTMVELGYAGSRGIHLPGQLLHINPPKPQILPDGRLFFPLNGALLNPAFGRIGMRDTQFNSFYQSLLVSVRKRLSNGLRFQAKYTWAKSIDEVSTSTFTDFQNSDGFPTMLNFRQNRGLSDFDFRHAFAANASYTIPGAGSGVLRAITGGWQLHSLVQLQTGAPFSPAVGFDRARLGGSTDLGQRPNLIATAGMPLILGDPQQYFNPLAFGLPDAGTYGNLGRNVLRGPGQGSFDAALHRTLWKRESAALTLRVETFNVTNHPNFQVPSSTALFDSRGARVGSAGRITATSTPPRQIQLALRLAF